MTRGQMTSQGWPGGQEVLEVTSSIDDFSGVGWGQKIQDKTRSSEKLSEVPLCF